MGFGAGWGEIIGPLIGTGLGLALEDHNDKRQIRQQQALTDQQQHAQQNLMDYSQIKQMQMWNDTNYPAQVEMLKKAGLNPALLYGKGGGGGVTTGSFSGSVGGAQAPSGGGEVQSMTGMGMQMAMQMKLMNAQVKNIEADTANKEAENPNIGKKGTNLDADTTLKQKQVESLTAGINNTEAETALKKVALEIQKWDLNFKDQTLDDQIKTLHANSVRAIDEAQMAMNNAKISKETVDAKISEIKGMAVGQWIKNALNSAEIKNTNANTELQKANTALSNQAFGQNVQRLMIDWSKLDQENKRIHLQQLMNDSQINKNDMDILMHGIDEIIKGGFILAK